MPKLDAASLVCVNLVDSFLKVLQHLYVDDDFHIGSQFTISIKYPTGYLNNLTKLNIKCKENNKASVDCSAAVINYNKRLLQNVDPNLAQNFPFHLQIALPYPGSSRGPRSGPTDLAYAHL